MHLSRSLSFLWLNAKITVELRALSAYNTTQGNRSSIIASKPINKPDNYHWLNTVQGSARAVAKRICKYIIRSIGTTYS